MKTSFCLQVSCYCLLKRVKLIFASGWSVFDLCMFLSLYFSFNLISFALLYFCLTASCRVNRRICIVNWTFSAFKLQHIYLIILWVPKTTIFSPHAPAPGLLPPRYATDPWTDHSDRLSKFYSRNSPIPSIGLRHSLLESVVGRTWCTAWWTLMRARNER